MTYGNVAEGAGGFGLAGVVAADGIAEGVGDGGGVGGAKEDGAQVVGGAG